MSRGTRPSTMADAVNLGDPDEAACILPLVWSAVRVRVGVWLWPAVVVALAACGGGPPEELGGFALGMTQAEVLETAGAAGSFRCRLRGTRPSITTCEGATPEGRVRVLVRSDVARSITLHKDPSDSDPRRTMRRFVRGFGDAAWQERPVPPRSERVEGYHTLWLNDDSTRSVAATCAGTGLRPPCEIEIATTSTAAVQAKLDSLLGIRR